MTRTILVVVQMGPHYSPALRRAIAMARAGDYRLNLCLFENNPAIEQVSHINAEVAELARETYIGERRKWVHELAVSLCKAGLDVRGDLYWGTPAYKTMLKVIAGTEPDLVVKDMHQETRLRRALLTPEDWHLLRECAQPLMLVNSKSHPLPNRVIAAVDPVADAHSRDSLNEHLLQAAGEIATLNAGSVHVAHVVDSGIPAGVTEPLLGATAIVDAMQQNRDLHESRFAVFMHEHALAGTSSHLLYGNPGAALAEYACDPRTDLLVLGSIQRGWFERLKLGSTAEHILNEASCDLLVIKPQDREPAPKRRGRRAAPVHAPLASP